MIKLLLLKILSILCVTGARGYTAKECRDLANSGDCEFYKCVDEIYLGCGEDGYPVENAFKYCTGLKQQRMSFTSKGREWIDNTIPCIMKEIWPHTQDISSTRRSKISRCTFFREVAFKVQHACYAEHNFCGMIHDEGNWENLAGVFDTESEFILGYDAAAAWDQIQDNVFACKVEMSEPFDNIPLGTEKQAVSPDTGTSSTCIQYAVNGDCRFYECFEQRFPCGMEYKFSFVKDFEILSCHSFYEYRTFFDKTGEDWMKDSQKCLMEKLLPLYQSGDDVPCSDLHSLASYHRAQCYIEAGFCGMLDTNTFALDMALDLDGYPFTTSFPPHSITSEILDDSVQATEYYYRTTNSLRHLVGGALPSKCHKMGLRQHEALYEIIESDQCEMTPCFIKVKN